MKIAIIGTGISGLSLANMLKDKHDVILFEKDERQGGLIKCDISDSVLFHRVGGHVFNSKNKKVTDWFWSHFNKESEFLKVNRNAKILFKNRIIGYPIENYIYNFNKKTIETIIQELLDLENKGKQSWLNYDNFEQFLKDNFGTTLYEIYFKPYNNKIWKVDLSTVPMPWLEGKLPMPNFKEIIVSNITRQEEKSMVHSSFFYPKVGGSQFIVDRLSQNLDIRTGYNITHIEKINNQYIIDKQLQFDSVVYCGDIRKMPDYFEKTLSRKIDLNEIKKLRSNGTSNLLCETDDNDISWLYIPEEFTSAHRIIYTGNFSSTNNGNRKRKTCVVEFSEKMKYDDMISEIEKLPGNLSPITYNYEPNSYIIHDFKTKNIIDQTKKILKEENIHLLGRFAEWEYYNMDKCIEAALNLAETL